MTTPQRREIHSAAAAAGGVGGLRGVIAGKLHWSGAEGCIE